MLLGGSLHELTHISDLGRTAQGFLGILVISLPFYFALRGVAVPTRGRIATAFFANAASVVILVFLIVSALTADFVRGAKEVSVLGFASLPVLVNAIVFGLLWRKARTANMGAKVSECGQLEVHPDDLPRLPAAHSHASYLVRHWRGELPLWVAFWLNWLVIAAATTSVLRTLVGEMLIGGYPVRSIAIAGISVSAGVLLVWLWSVVGVWRSASRRRATSAGRLWPVFARGIVVLGVIGTLQQLRLQTVPEIVENARFLVGPDSIGNVGLHLSADRRVLGIHGMLGAGAYDAIKAALDQSPTVEMLDLDSAGGRMFEAAAIAHLIGDRRLDVTVANECSSACTLVLLGGRNRIAWPTAWIGFHRPGGQGLDKMAEANLTSRSVILYRRAGLPEDFITRIHQTSIDNMWYPRMDELKASGVITHVAADSGR